MRVKSLTVLIIFILAIPSLALASPLGIAGNYNIFVKSDINLKLTDSFGGVAAGGNVVLEDFSAGSHLKASLPLGDLVVGQSLDFTRGSVGPTDQKNGSIIYGDSATFSGFDLDSHQLSQGYPIDFDAEWKYLASASALWSTLPVNGATSFMVNDKNEIFNIELQGTHDTLNVFDIGSMLNNGTSIDLHSLRFYLNVPASSTILVNVPGEDIALHEFSFHFKEPEDAAFTEHPEDPAVPDTRILYNLFEADTLSLHTISMQGSVLAPHAAVNFFNGHIDGNLIAWSLSGENTGNFTGGEAHDKLFDGDLPYLPVPEPGSLFLVVCGLLFLGILKSRWAFADFGK